MQKNVYDENDIILFTDGSDVIFNSRLEELEKLYVSVERPDTILFNGEISCFPKHAACYTNPGEKLEQVRFRYINSGCWMARWHVVRRFIPLWAEYIRRYSTTLRSIEVANRNATDQGALHMYSSDVESGIGLALSLSPNAPRVMVDSGCKIFQTTVNTALNSPHWKAVGNNQNVYINDKSGELWNTITRSRPLFLHFNGVFAKPYVIPVATYLSKIHRTRTSRTISYIWSVIKVYYSRYPELEFCHDYFTHIFG